VPLAVAVIALSLQHMDESRDDTRDSRVDWAGAVLTVLGLGAIVFGLLEWPRLEANQSIVRAAIGGGIAALIAFVIFERRVPAPMLPIGLFRSRTFTLANVLTLFLYAALGTMLWLVPLNLIQVQDYTATSAGAAFLPLPILMFTLSRWSGGLVARVRSRVPLTLGPIVAAVGLALFARPGIGGSYWTTFFPAVVVLGFGLAIAVAPLTTTAMTAVETQHAGVASGVNNAVARVGGLVGIAVFGIALVRVFNTRVSPALDQLRLPAIERAAVDRELPKLAGANVDIPEPTQRAGTERAIDEAFVSAFRLVMIGTSALALAAAVAGGLIREQSPALASAERATARPSGTTVR